MNKLKSKYIEQLFYINSSKEKNSVSFRLRISKKRFLNQKTQQEKKNKNNNNQQLIDQLHQALSNAAKEYHNYHKNFGFFEDKLKCNIINELIQDQDSATRKAINIMQKAINFPLRKYAIEKEEEFKQHKQIKEKKFAERQQLIIEKETQELQQKKTQEKIPHTETDQITQESKTLTEIDEQQQQNPKINSEIITIEPEALRSSIQTEENTPKIMNQKQYLTEPQSLDFEEKKIIKLRERDRGKNPPPPRKSK